MWTSLPELLLRTSVTTFLNDTLNVSTMSAVSSIHFVDPWGTLISKVRRRTYIHGGLRHAAASPNGSGKHGTHGIHNDLFLVQGLRCTHKYCCALVAMRALREIVELKILWLFRFLVTHVARARSFRGSNSRGTEHTLITHPLKLKSEREK